MIVQSEVVVPLAPDAEKRLKRLRALSWFLDRAFPLGQKRRFGVDPILGLIPGLGDWIGAALSFYVFYEAARLGLPWRVLGRMLGNIAIEAAVGAVPFAGDVFDFLWQANTRNLRLVELHHHPRMKPRSIIQIAALLIIAAMILIGIVVAALWGMVVLIERIFA